MLKKDDSEVQPLSNVVPVAPPNGASCTSKRGSLYHEKPPYYRLVSDDRSVVTTGAVHRGFSLERV